jgi:serine phosphatase RsbU (regulator of sigma subunit)
VTDAKGSSEEAFGTDRLDATLARGIGGSRAMIGRVLAALEEFAGTGPPADDYTLLAMTFVRSRKKAGDISGEWRAVGR